MGGRTHELKERKKKKERMNEREKERKVRKVRKCKDTVFILILCEKMLDSWLGQ